MARDGDLADAWYAIAATDDAQVNAAVVAEAVDGLVVKGVDLQSRRAEQAREQDQVLASGEVLVHRGHLAREADETAHGVGLGDDVVAEHAGAAGVRAQQGGEHADRGRLAGAVGTDQADNPALVDAQVDAVDGTDMRDRVLEDRTLLREGPKSGPLAATWKTFRFFMHNVSLMLRSEWHRFGYACVNFGTPISMREYCRSRGIDFQALSAEARRAAVAALGTELMRAVGRIVPVVPVPLLAAVFVAQPQRALSELELKAEVGRLLARLEAAGAHVYIPRGDLDYALTVGLRMLRLRRLVEEQEGLFRARQEEIPLLAYYANSIAHLT